ncbi:hypothetical protein C5167_021187 [Papaver somniferum]|uniref:Uncharacterized protein n=1 Tax=Papaver somniferum TaxID=3469 RepID=A0A4Y7IYE2_PAPSO|nr:uncharacterized protein LOC113354497 [Papaver somniferum]RZC52762.1 hypothetical protein C5167_021187 [Papaver somniferum]
MSGIGNGVFILYTSRRADPAMNQHDPAQFTCYLILGLNNVPWRLTNDQFTWSIEQDEKERVFLLELKIGEKVFICGFGKQKVRIYTSGLACSPCIVIEKSPFVFQREVN